jgi:hypothetical protein
MSSQTIKTVDWLIDWGNDTRIMERGNEKDRKLHVTIMIMHMQMN